MSDTNINPVALSSAVVAGAVGATVAAKAKPLVNKAVNMATPVVDTVSVSAKKAASSASESLGELAVGIQKFFVSLEKTIVKGLNVLKDFVVDLVGKIKLPETSSKLVNNTKNILKKPAVIAGVTAGALYTGYKLISSQKEDR